MTKIALVTGANQGIGFEIVRQLAQKGYLVYLGSRSADKGKEAVTKLHNENLNKVKLLEIDVVSDASVAQALASFQGEQDHLDILVNNAGVLGNPADASLEAIKAVYEVNTFGVIRVIQAFLPQIQKSTFPIVLNISTYMASLTHQSNKNSPSYSFQFAGYNTSKSALNAYTVYLASVIPNGKVNCVHPGHVQTNINGYTGPLTPKQAVEEILKCSVFIDVNGPTASFMNYDGSVLPW